MWTAVALTTVLTLPPAQALELKNVRTTHGILGETRKDDKVLPGDVVVVAFDIDGLKTKDNGLVQYEMGMSLTKTGKTKPEFKQDPKEFEAENCLGGTTLPAYAYYFIDINSDPGEYTARITIKDRQTKAEKVLTKTFEVVPTALGFVRLRLSSPNGDPIPPVAVPGQRILVHSALVGFKLNKDKKAHVNYKMVIEDDAGKPTVAKPFEGDIQAKIEATPGMMTFTPRDLDLNKPGKYKIVITAKCHVTGETTKQTLNLNVLKSTATD